MVAVSFTPYSTADLPLTLLKLNYTHQEQEDYFLGLIAAGVATQQRITATAGEGLADRASAYLSLDDNKIYEMDADAAGPKAGHIRGFVDGATLNGASATLVIGGPMSGFSGLTAWQKVYVGATAGSKTQTRPYPSLDGAQVMIAEMGFALSSTSVLVKPAPIQYQKRAALIDNETLTIEHHADEQSYTRRLFAYFNENSASSVTYSSSNQDSEVALEGATGAGGTVTITATGSSNRIGDTSGTERWQSQSFLVVNAGILSQFTVELDPNAGSPTGDITWEICSDNAGSPGTALATSSFTPTANATNTITVLGANKIFLAASTTYWLVLKAVAQATNAGYVWQAQGSSSYADGVSKYSPDAGSSWVANAGDCQMSITTLALTTGAKLAQTINLAAASIISHVGLYLRKLGSPTGTITLRIETVSAGNPTGTLAHADATATISEASLTGALTEVLVSFAAHFALNSGDYAIVLSTDRASSVLNYVTWGADASAPGYAGGEMKTYAGSWSAASKDSIFTVYYPNPSAIAVDWWSSSFADVVNRYGDGAGSELSTKTTFKCLRDAGFVDIILGVELD